MPQLDHIKDGDRENRPVNAGNDERRIRVMAVDDHDLILEGVSRRFSSAPDTEFIGSAVTVSAALELAETSSPDVVLVDIRLGGQSGFELCRQLKELDGRIRVILISGECPRSDWPRVSKCGADGFIRKGEPNLDYPAMVRHAMEGRFVLSPGLWRDAWNALVLLNAPSILNQDEIRILELVAARKYNGEISRELGISESTVGKRLTSIYRQLGAAGRGDVVEKWRRYLATGELSPGES
jgi:DNA-binding NarL/FixJ family response regulator